MHGVPSPRRPDEWGYRALARSLASVETHNAWLGQVLDYIDGRLDLADHQLLVLLKLTLSAGDELDDRWAARIRQTVVGFRYGITEPGEDNMCTWTENHQLLFATCEYFAGQLYPREVFGNDGRRGSVKHARAKERLLRWLEDRFHHGFSEWLSNTYYDLVVAGLTLLVDHAADEDLATRAAMVLDLVLLDMALHRYDGHFQAPGGRVYRSQKMHPERAETEAVMQAAFGVPPRFNHTQVSGIFVARERYEVPPVITEIATADGARVIRSSHGRDIEDAMRDVAKRHRSGHDEDRLLDQVLTAWGQQAYVTPETVTITMRALERYRLGRNRFLKPLSAFTKVPSGVGQRALLKTLKPIIEGTALHRANVLTYRTPNYQISSVQSYRPGEFGDQQHLWQASLPGGINIFSTHPGSTHLAGEARPGTPSAWVGNGINPQVGQHHNVVMVLHDLGGRRGYLEARRHEFTHLYFPFVKFDQTQLGSRLLAGRVGTSLVGVLSLERLEMVSQTEVVQRGGVTGWALVTSDLSEFRSLAEFTVRLKQASLRLKSNRMTLDLNHANSPSSGPAAHRYQLTWRGGFAVDGVGQNNQFQRYDCDWVRAVRQADRIVVRGLHQSLTLSWRAGTRVQG